MSRRAISHQPSAISKVLAVAILLMSQASCRGEQGKAESTDGRRLTAAVLGPHDVAQVVKTDVVEGIPVSGTLEPAVDVKIASPIAEVIDAVLVNEGEAVKKGQVLVRFQSG